MSDGRKNNGGHSNGGRKKKSEEQNLIENLTPLNKTALTALKDGLNKKQNWAVKLFFEYFYGKPQQKVDVTTKGDKLGIPTINFTDGED